MFAKIVLQKKFSQLRVICIFLVPLFSCNTDPQENNIPHTTSTQITPKDREWLLFQNQIEKAYLTLPKYLEKKLFNEKYVVIADLSIHSGLPRMALIDLKSKTILDSGCVAHGYGKDAFSEKASFSNIPNSHFSSLGRYKIGTKYSGNFGSAYKLNGLDSSNSNAYSRFIVLHSYYCIPDSPPYPQYICNSQGCPMISPNFFDRLSKYIDGSSKPILLSIVN